MQRAMQRAISRGLAVLAGLAFASAVVAAQAAPPGCGGPEHRQFDFWTGSWTVTDSAGQRVMGQNRITSEEGGCLLHERWTGGGATANTGRSLNAYDRGTRMWGRDWVGSGGDVLHLRGGLFDGWYRRDK